MPNILQFKITLKNSDPKIWRRFLVKDDVSFYDLHLIIQNIMGWYNSHLYQFIYEQHSFIGDPVLMESDDTVDAKGILLKEIFTAPKNKIMYEYDMGDGWMHELILEKITEAEKKKFQPLCIAGEKKCPPEDCGGIHGFHNILQILKKKKGKEYREIKEWLGGDYNPDEFDLDYINENLKHYKDIDMDSF